jgi:hypothetical protein
MQAEKPIALCQYVSWLTPNPGSVIYNE